MSTVNHLPKGELRSAAERQVLANMYQSSGDARDICLVCEAYLSEYPADDDEPVSYDEVEQAFTAGNELIFQLHGKIFVGCDVPIRTRGDVRRLHKALGIEVSK